MLFLHSKFMLTDYLTVSKKRKCCNGLKSTSEQFRTQHNPHYPPQSKLDQNP